MNKILISSIISLLILAAIATGIYFYSRYSIVLVNPLQAVPADAAFVVEVKKPSLAIKDFFNNESGRWQQVAANTKIKNQILQLDSLISSGDRFKEIWENESLVVSSHLAKSGKYDYLLAINLPRGWSQRNLKNLALEFFRVDIAQQYVYQDVKIYQIVLNDSMQLTFASNKSIAVFSTNPVLIEQAIRQLDKPESIFTSKDFKKISGGNKSHGIYLGLNYPLIRNVLQSLTSSGNIFIDEISAFADWSILKVTKDKNGLLLNGSTFLKDSTALLTLIHGQQRQQLGFPAICPNRTAFIVSIGLSDNMTFMKQVEKSVLRIGGKYIAQEWDNVETREKVKHSFSSWVGNEIGFFITETNTKKLENNFYGFIKARDAKKSILELAQLPGTFKRVQTENYKGFQLGHLIPDKILGWIYGKLFATLNETYFIVVNDYVLFASQPAALKALIDDIESGKTLAQDSTYQKSLAAVALNQNAIIGLNASRAGKFLPGISTTSNFPFMNDLKKLWVGFRSEGSVIKTTAFADYSKTMITEPVLLWTFQPDTLVITELSSVRDDDNNSYLLFQDALRQLYKIDAAGQIQNKKILSSSIISEILVVDLYHDGRKELLFNSTDSLYMLDLNFQPVANFPIRLPSKTNFGIRVADQGEKDPVIYLACSNNTMYAYELNAKPVATWSYPKITIDKLKWFNAFGDKYHRSIVAVDTTGAAVVYDKVGKKVSDFVEQWHVSPGNIVFAAGKDSSGNMLFATTNSNGNLVRFKPDGTLSAKSSYEFSANHQYRYLNSDDNIHVVLDNKSIVWFNDKGIVSMPVELRKDLDEKISLHVFKKEKMVAATNVAKDLTNMYNNQGKLLSGFPVTGSGKPGVFDLGKINLVLLNRAGVLYCYGME